MGPEILLAWMLTITELSNGLVELTAIGNQILAGQHVSDEYLATLRAQHKEAVDRLKAAAIHDKEQDHGEVPETTE